MRIWSQNVFFSVLNTGSANHGACDDTWCLLGMLLLNEICPSLAVSSSQSSTNRVNLIQLTKTSHFTPLPSLLISWHARTSLSAVCAQTALIDVDVRGQKFQKALFWAASYNVNYRANILYAISYFTDCNAKIQWSG